MRRRRDGSEFIRPHVLPGLRLQLAPLCRLDFDPSGWEHILVDPKTEKVILQGFTDDQIDPGSPVRCDYD